MHHCTTAAIADSYFGSIADTVERTAVVVFISLPYFAECSNLCSSSMHLYIRGPSCHIRSQR